MGLSAAHVRKEIPFLLLSLKSSILRSTSFQIDETYWGEVSAAVEQSWRKANTVWYLDFMSHFAQGDGKFGP